MKVQLLDEHQEVVLDSQVDECTEIEGFSETEIPITLSLSTSLAPGRYEVKLLLSAHNLGCVSLYHVSGRLVKRVTSADGHKPYFRSESWNGVFICYTLSVTGDATLTVTLFG